MANTAANVLAGRPLSTGGILRAALGTALPTDAVTSPNVAFAGQGYIGNEGVQETIGRNTDQVTAWGTDVVKVVQSSFNVSYQFTFLETLNAEVMKAVYGTANITTTAATSLHGAQIAAAINSKSLDHFRWILEVKDGLAKVRIVIPDGQISEVGQVTYNDGAVIGYQVTLQAFADSSGNQAYKYTDDGILVP